MINFYRGNERDDYFLLKGTDKRLGVPIYRFGYELVHRRFYPEKRISNLCVEYVRKHGRQDFFKKPTWRKDLLKIIHPYRKRRKAIGFYEGQRGWETRIGIEISRSKRMIEETIGGGKKVLFFAYPWGAYDNELIHQLKRAGYRGAFTSGPGIHYLGEDPYQIKRIPIPSGTRHDDLISILKQ